MNKGQHTHTHMKYHEVILFSCRTYDGALKYR